MFYATQKNLETLAKALFFFDYHTDTRTYFRDDHPSVLIPSAVTSWFDTRIDFPAPDYVPVGEEVDLKLKKLIHMAEEHEQRWPWVPNQDKDSGQGAQPIDKSDNDRFNESLERICDAAIDVETYVWFIIKLHFPTVVTPLQTQDGADFGSKRMSADPPESVALTPDEQAFFDVLTDEPQTGPDLVAKLARAGIRNFEESKISRMRHRQHLKARGVRHRQGAGYYLIQCNSKSTAT